MRKLTSVGFAVAGLSLILAACSGSSSGSAFQTSTTVATSGGTVRWAEQAGSAPNWIFPFATPRDSSMSDTSQFQYLLYRPLYMFGPPQTTELNLNAEDSIGNAPVYSKSDNQAVITLKNYKWSDGETVNATDVLFFMNMLHAEKSTWYAYTPGAIPDNVTNVTVNSPTELTITFNRPYITQWMTYNQLSQITPFPQAWDVTALGGAPGSGGCSTAAYGSAAADSDCSAVYNFLDTQATDLSTYATSPIWSVVDGPFKLASFDSTGAVTMVPNRAYSGTDKPSISKFDEIPFATTSAEFQALTAGQVDIGYLPQEDVTSGTTSPSVAGQNNAQMGNYYLDPWVLFAIDYSPINFNSNGNNGTTGALFRQLYIRQALQLLVNQPALISTYLKGYGVGTYGPVPLLPQNGYVSSQVQGDHYVYSVSKATGLLRSHGWSIAVNGTDTCTKPGSAAGECGADIPAGTPLSLQMQYTSGVGWMQEVASAEASAWAQAGINVSLSSAALSTVVGSAVACAGGSTCAWQISWSGNGWVYSPDQYPTGEGLFQTGGAFNVGSYTDPLADATIQQTYTTSTTLIEYENYLSQQLPVIWQPNADYQLTEIRNDLQGVTPQNPFGVLYPEEWSYTR